jgi:hypothetical protein
MPNKLQIQDRMKNNLFLIGMFVLSTACGQPAPVSKPKPNEVSPSQLFTAEDAEKALGEAAHITDSSSGKGKNLLSYSSAWFANAKDSISGRTGCIYFTFERYEKLEAAKKKYAFIKTANQDHGIKVLNDIGDEAYFHTDGQGFYFIMVRKGTNVFNMKVNKITSKTSLDGFYQVARKVTNKLH